MAIAIISSPLLYEIRRPVVVPVNSSAWATGTRGGVCNLMRAATVGVDAEKAIVEKLIVPCREQRFLRPLPSC